MGLLVRTPDDDEVITKLIARFGGPKLKDLQTRHYAGFDSGSLVVPAADLGIYPGPANGPRAYRWFAFLGDLYANHFAVSETARAAIKECIDDTSFVRIIFDYVGDTTWSIGIADQGDNRKVRYITYYAPPYPKKLPNMKTQIRELLREAKATIKS